MATELAKAYVQIVPSAKGIHGSITKELSGEADAAGKASGESIGNGLVGKLKGIIAAAGLGAVVKQALDAGGALQQSFGGLDTLYGDASAAAKEYALQAAEAGISANSYAEQAVSFGAALKSAFEGDTTKAVKAANTAILDMADNSAKMGTDIASIQTAYQGFAKQNYTMLDNLKLGYGGTKSEMERLLKTASELETANGKTFDINNLGDVYEAIHLIQEDLGLTGVAADEAKSTFTGSMGAMKAAAENTLAALTTGGDVENALYTLTDSAFTFLQNNAIQMIQNLISALPGAITQIWLAALTFMEKMAADSGSILGFVTSFVSNLMNTFSWMLPQLVFSGVEILGNILQAILEFDWLSFGAEMIANLQDALDVSSREYGLGWNITEVITQFISEGLPDVLQKGTEIVLNIVNGIGEKLPDVINSATQIIKKLLDTLLANMPQIMQKGVEAVMNIVAGIVNNLPQIAQAIGQLISTLIQTIVTHLPEILLKGVELVIQIATGIVQALPQIVTSIGSIIKGIIDGFEEVNWGEVGSNLIEGIKSGVMEAASRLWEAVKDVAEQALDGVKDFLGIASPSKVFRDQVGRFIPEGIAAGILGSVDVVSKAMDDVVDKASIGFTAKLSDGMAGAGAVREKSAVIQITTPIYLGTKLIATEMNRELGVLL